MQRLYEWQLYPFMRTTNLFQLTPSESDKKKWLAPRCALFRTLFFKAGDAKGARMFY